MSAKLLLCNCAGTQTPDPDTISRATGLACSRLHAALCTHEIGEAAEAMNKGNVIIACAQEEATFAALADETGQPAPLCTDIRDRAGWSADKADKTPKIAALLAAATRPRAPAKTMDIVSSGVCLVLGKGETALEAAAQLAPHLTVSCVIEGAAETGPGARRAFDLHQGLLRSASGALGAFHVTFDAFAPGLPGGRGPQDFAAPRDGAASECDIILDLRGGAPLFPASEKRDGYLRADPGDPRAVARAVFDAAQMLGTFEKPLHIAFDESKCAHSRARQTACTRCLDVCPTGAILSAGDTVSINPAICAGCGACAAVCPSGAATYDDPRPEHVFALLRDMAAAYRAAGGSAPRLLVHDADHGREMIALAARYGRGLPADVIPYETEALGAFGHAETLVALASGFSAVDILMGPKADRTVIEAEAALAAAIAPDGPERIRTLEPAEPDALSDLLFGSAPASLAITAILALGGRREAARLAAKALHPEAKAPLPLPDGAPYGALQVETDACTLCLSCVSLCPSAALTENPDKPELRFQEDACLQCGLCVTICPENAITLAPQLDLSDAALAQKVMHSEEPAACIECGALFGVQSTIDRIVAKLEGSHPMFAHSDNARLIRMCDDCRVQAQYHANAAPFSAAPRPQVRTTEDYLKDRDE